MLNLVELMIRPLIYYTTDFISICGFFISYGICILTDCLAFLWIICFFRWFLLAFDFLFLILLYLCTGTRLTGILAFGQLH